MSTLFNTENTLKNLISLSLPLQILGNAAAVLSRVLRLLPAGAHFTPGCRLIDCNSASYRMTFVDSCEVIHGQRHAHGSTRWILPPPLR